MKKPTSRHKCAAGCALALFSAPLAHAAGDGELGILDTFGTNPATGVEWAVGDTYHLIFVTTGTTDATSNAITDYNAFVQGDADSQTGAFANMGNVNWFALGSTETTDAIDNAVITAPVVGAFDSGAVAVDASDFWDFSFPDPNPINQLDGTDKNVWTGTAAGGTADSGDELGATNGETRRHWTGWTDWGPANANQANSDLREMVAISQELTVVPESSAALLIGVAGLALLRRRR